MKTRDQKRSKLQEIRASREYGGSLTPGSGNTWVKKGDLRTEDEMFEFKTTNKETYSLSASELMRLRDHALLDNKIPVFEIEFAARGVTCVVLMKDDFIAIAREKE